MDTNINGDENMSNEEAYKIQDDFDRWDENNARKTFLARMEHKFNLKERRARS